MTPSEQHERQVGSYQSRVVVRGTASQAVDEYVSYWANAILSDLFGLLNDIRVDNLGHALDLTAPVARAWFRDAWSSASRLETFYPIIQFTLTVYAEPNQQGAVLAVIDVLTGDYTIGGTTP